MAPVTPKLRFIKRVVKKRRRARRRVIFGKDNVHMFRKPFSRRKEYKTRVRAKEVKIRAIGIFVLILPGKITSTLLTKVLRRNKRKRQSSVRAVTRALFLIKNFCIFIRIYSRIIPKRARIRLASKVSTNRAFSSLRDACVPIVMVIISISDPVFSRVIW